jgi:hypothetical protein
VETLAASRCRVAFTADAFVARASPSSPTWSSTPRRLRRLVEAQAASGLRMIVINGSVVIVVTATSAASWKRWRRRAGPAS